MNLGLVVATIIAFLFFTARAKAKASKDYAMKQKKKIHNKFAMYYNNVLIRGTFRRVVEMYSSLSCYDYDTVKMQSVQLFERNMAIAIGLPIVAFVIMRDVGFVLLSILLSMVYYQSTVEGEMDKIYIRLMEECSLTISSIREKYLETDNIPLAILYSEKSKYLEVPMSNIYRILTEADGDDRLIDFQRSYPVKIVKTLAHVCYIVNTQGAVKTADGGDSFKDDMTVLRQECDSEIRRLTKQKIAFKSLKTLTLVGLLIMPICEWYLLSQIPGTAVLIKGFYGMAIHWAVILTTMYSYNYICNSCRPSVVNQVDKISFVTALSKRREVYNFVKNIFPKKYRTQQKINNRIRGALSSKDFRYIYTFKVFISVSVFIGSFILLVFAMITIRDGFKNNYDSLSFIPTSVTDSQQAQIIKMDDDFITKSWKEYNDMEDADMTEYVKGRVSGMADSDIANQVDRLRRKYETYKKATFHWWFVLVSFACACVSWFAPEFSLNTRKKMVSYEASDDVMQLQTIMIVLSDTKMDVYDSVCWLEKQSSIHKAVIAKCHYSYTADPMKALDDLEYSTPLNDFKRLVRKLKSAVYTLSLHDAFSDVALDKAQSLTLREMLRNEELEERKNSAKLIAVIPAGIALIGCFIGPVLILGISEMMKTLSGLGEFTG